MTNLAQAATRELVVTEGGPTYRIKKRLRIIQENTPRIAIAAYVIAAVLFILIPLFVFAPVLFKTKISGMAKYGSLATEYTQSFQQKWIVDRRNQQDALLGTADISIVG